MAETLTLYSHRYGPNSWKTIVLILELDIPYETIFLDSGDGKNGVEATDFLVKNPAGRVPLIYDPKTGTSLAESNAITQYLVDHYDKSGRLTSSTKAGNYTIQQWLFFQAASQGAMYAQSLIASGQENTASVKHFQATVKRTLGTLNSTLDGKSYLVGEKCTVADLSFLNWDLILDNVLRGDSDVSTMEQRTQLFPHWAAWHKRLLQRPSVQAMIKLQKEAIGV